MSKSRLDEMLEVGAELKEKGVSLDVAIAAAEDRLSLLRAIRAATRPDGGGKVKPAGERKPKARKPRDAAPAGEAPGAGGPVPGLLG